MSKQRMVLSAQTENTFTTETLLGQEYLVVPVIAMVEGVRFGAMSQGVGELGLADEFGKVPAGWDSRPVVMNHPMIENDYVSANSPAVLETYCFGMTMNTEVVGKKLRMEAWLNTSMRNKSDGIANVFARIEKGETIEVSVGFFCDLEDSSGDYNGEHYGAVWKNIVPDHLALLSEGVLGACSIEDGCGVPRINLKGGVLMSTLKLFGKKGGSSESGGKSGGNNNGSKKSGGTMPKTYAGAEADAETTTECSCHAEKGAVVLSTQWANPKSFSAADINQQTLSAMQHLIAQTIPNDVLSNDVENALCEELSEMYDYAYLIGYTNEYAVFQVYGHNGWTILRRQFDMTVDGVITFSGEPEEVTLMTRIVPTTEADTSTSGNDINVNQEQEDKMSKETTEGQEGTEGTTGTAAGTEGTVNTEGTTTNETSGEGGTKEGAEGGEGGEGVDTPSVQSYINSAPEGIREVLQHSLNTHQAAKNNAIKALKASGRCQFDDAYLSAQTLETLEKLNSLANVTNYSGKAAPVTNAAQAESATTAPTRMFTKKA